MEDLYSTKQRRCRAVRLWRIPGLTSLLAPLPRGSQGTFLSTWLEEVSPLAVCLFTQRKRRSMSPTLGYKYRLIWQKHNGSWYRTLNVYHSSQGPFGFCQVLSLGATPGTSTTTRIGRRALMMTALEATSHVSK